VPHLLQRAQDLEEESKALEQKLSLDEIRNQIKDLENQKREKREK